MNIKNIVAHCDLCDKLTDKVYITDDSKYLCLECLMHICLKCMEECLAHIGQKYSTGGEEEEDT